MAINLWLTEYVAHDATTLQCMQLEMPAALDPGYIKGLVLSSTTTCCADPVAVEYVM